MLHHGHADDALRVATKHPLHGLHRGPRLTSDGLCSCYNVAIFRAQHYNILSIKYLSELAESSESDSVRLGAIKDLLDRAGLKPVERIEQTTVEKMSDEEIQRELDSLLKH